MKCIHCGAPTDVRETRDAGVATTRRVRVCFNGHRFTTLEVPPGTVSRKDLLKARTGVGVRQRAFRRQQIVRSNPTLPAATVARLAGITEARVRQIRAKAAAQ